MNEKEAIIPPPFEVQVMSGPDYEDLFAEVLYDDELCFVVSQEAGYDRLRVAIHARRSGEPWDFSAKDLEQVLRIAGERLWELRRRED